MTGAREAVVVRAGRLDEAAHLDEIARTAKASWGYPREWIERWGEELRVDPRALVAGDVFVAEAGGECVGWTGGGPGGGSRGRRRAVVARPGDGDGRPDPGRTVGIVRLLGLLVLVWAGGARAAAAQQVVPQRGRVDTEMNADSLSTWSAHLGFLTAPVVRSEAFDRLGAGFGVRGGLAGHFANGLAVGAATRWLRAPDELADGAATLLDVTAEFLWTHDTGPWRVEAGPVLGWVWLTRDVLTRTHSGGAGGAVVRVWRPLGDRTALGVSGDLLWALLGELDFVSDLPRDPDGMAYGQIGSIAVLFSIEAGGRRGMTRVGTPAR